MRIVLLACFYFFLNSTFAQTTEKTPPNKPTLLVIPYMPAMHLSDADQDIAEGSQIDLGEVRTKLRTGIVTKMNQRFADVYDARVPDEGFVKSSDRDYDMLYHSIAFEQDSTYPFKNPKKFAVVDTTIAGKKAKKKDIDKTFINGVVRDPQLLPDYSKKYGADYFILLNELDIKTHFEDCINLAMKIYRRDIKIHYTIYNKRGEELYGDVAVVHFPSNSNDVDQIINENFPKISDYVYQSFLKCSQ
jgi:hypothetical protein